jgi:hypothetical protein
MKHTGIRNVSNLSLGYYLEYNKKILTETDNPKPYAVLHHLDRWDKIKRWQDVVKYYRNEFEENVVRETGFCIDIFSAYWWLARSEKVEGWDIIIYQVRKFLC